ncbi:hypothetical protein TWF102_005803 [Orbilia oligospora]|uniref:Uncharacterized protein n=1 Tax=Orbilia oligospora TaxID=2813651 RepID=A0A7C8NIM5_ORBOL|nr:hypothetical protein TWF706_006972 [Orbilia oligospora]KAF3112057.1 hypothetical protein TWF102_005803 [Orbilia oligospora]KAF3113291.1 hypothetical protein TWF103_002454 [Orbilia oligospora]KAF3147427.1 hypothetical protein TWF594_002647 [Orbilia oligospora]
METAPSTFWPQGYPPNFNAHSRTRIVDIGEHKLPLPLQPSLQYPIDRFNTGENPLPMGLIPDPVNTAYAGLNATAMPGLTFSPLDGDAGSSWHSSIRDDDQRSSSTDSSASGRGFPTWGQGSPVMSSYRSNSIGMPFPDAAVSPCESTSYPYKSSEVIDPNLTLNFQSADIYEPTIKFEFPFTNTIQDADFDQDSFSPDTQYYTQPVLPNFHDGNTWAHRVPVTRSQSQNDGRTHSQSSSRGSNNGSSRSSKILSRTPVSPISKRRAERRRSSSSSDDQPARSSNRPKTYKKKIPFHYCQEEGCKVDNVRFKNRSELKYATFCEPLLVDAPANDIEIESTLKPNIRSPTSASSASWVVTLASVLVMNGKDTSQRSISSYTDTSATTKTASRRTKPKQPSIVEISS